MSLTKALSKVGDSNIKFQWLSESFVDIKDKRRTDDTEITFTTRETNANDFYKGKGKVGIVVWADKDQLQEALSETCQEK